MTHNSDGDRQSRDLVWDVYKSLTAQCEHFNGIESTYRTLTSTWLLAAFAGIGFVLKDLSSPYRSLFITAVAASGAVGVYLLWLLDLMVYHRLLGAVFAQQLALETQHSWLPQVAHGMMRAHDGVGVVPKIVWYYISSYLVLAAIASVTAILGAASSTPWLGQVACMVGLFALTGVGIARRMYMSAITPTREHAEFNAKGGDNAA